MSLFYPLAASARISAFLPFSTSFPVPAFPPVSDGGVQFALRWEDVYDFEAKRFRDRLEVKEKKTGKTRPIPLSRHVIEALKKLMRERKGEFVFSNGRKNEKPISRVQAWRILRDAAAELKLTGNISCHSLRKTLGYFARKMRNVTPDILMLMYNHSDYRVTQRYLGITQEEVDRVYLGVEIL